MRGNGDFVLNVWIDDLTPCLKDNETGDFVQTEVIRIWRYDCRVCCKYGLGESLLQRVQSRAYSNASSVSDCSL